MRRPCLWVWLGLALLAFSWPGAQVSAEVGPTETECRPHIEKAINNLKAVDADSDSSKEEGLVNSIENEGQVDTEDDNANSAEANSAEDQTNDEQIAEDGDNSQENEEEAGSNEENTEGDQGVEEEEASEEVVSRSKRSLEETANDSEEAVDHKDTDGDEVPDDNDDNDGIPDHEDDDADNNGELSEEEKEKDSDGDGIPDYLDDDDDNDGIPDNLDDDDDNDGVPDSQDEDHENFNQNDDDSSEGGNHSGEAENQSGEVEAQSGEVANESGEDLERDTDGDGIPDHLDDDDDNDGIPDELDDDDDNDGIPDYLDEDHKDFGKSKEEISGEVENKSGEVVNESGEDLERDTDGDGIPDHLDDDDDNDGIPDELDDDDDNDGIPDHLDEDHPDFGKSKEETSAEVENTSGEDLERDTDGDGIPDYLDDDDDNDGIPDELDDDDDNDGVPDHLDEDHKDFGKSKEEVSGEVQNESGEAENQSGEVEAQSGEVVNESGEDLERDTDGDGIPDHLDDDDDNDGIPDELDDDDDNDGIPDYLDEDHKDFGKSKEEVSGEVVNQSADVEEESAEAETQSAEAETQSAEAENQSGEDEIDSDGDGIPDSLDDDDDNDGIPDHLDEDHPDYVKSTEDEEEKSAEVENQSEEAEEKDAEKSEEEPEAEAKSEEKSEDNVEAEESAEEVKEESEEKTEEVASVESANTDSEHPEEDLLIEYIVPKNLRNRDHITELLHLDDLSEIKEQVIAKNADVILKDLKRIYENSIKPLETLYKYRDLSNRHFGDPEIFSKPLILFMGPWSGGKSTLINYLTGNEYTENSLRTGAEPSPAYFNILMHGDKPEVLDGTQLAADWTFSGLQKFGQGLEDRLRGLKLPNKLLEKVNIVEIPGILEVRKQVSRLFPFNDACQWFIDRADIIFLVYDPSKLDVGPETEAILDQLKGREYQTRMLLNKADQVKPEELLRVQSALIWNISPLMSSAQPPIMYTTSLWSHPFQEWAPARLLIAQERAMLRDLRSAIDKRIENKIASARRFAVRVRNHAKMVDCYLTTYYNHKTLFGNKKMMADQIIDNPQNYHIYEGLSTLTNISRYDLPDPDVYRSFFRLNPLYEFKKLSETCTYFRGCPINKLDISIAYDLPELAGKYKKLVDQGLDELEKEENNKSSESAPPGKR